MQYRKLGETDLSVSVVTFGAWAAGGWMWGKTERSDAVDAIRAAYDLGVTSIDTAPIYGQGTSEEIVGEAIKGIPREKVQILTKFGMRWDANHRHFQPEFIERTNRLLKKIKPIADEKGVTLSQLVLRWTIEKPGITIALAGARNAAQSVQNAKAMDFELTAQEFDFIHKAVNEF